MSFFIVLANFVQAQKLTVFDSVPGRATSDHYVCRVKLENEDDTRWRVANVLQTRAKEESEDPEGGYYDNVRGWTASWIAFESDFAGENVIVEISNKDGSAITEAMVRPVGDASEATISNGKAYVSFTKPANINVDINGQLEKNYTGHGYTGPDVHTISIFANPIYRVPDTTSNNVKVLKPDEEINSLNRADWDTLIFAPGIHELGMDSLGEPIPFQVLSNEVLYIPGNAIVHGTIHPKNAWGDEASQNWTVYGSGTISGEKITREPGDQENKTTKPFTYQAEGARLEGFVVIDPAFHTFNMGNSRDNTTNINVYKNLKILAWRVNSDGINAFRHSEVSNCFFRVQDDAFYIGRKDVNQHDNVVWNDANGAVLFIQSAPDASTNVFRDVKVIYHRAYWHWWTGGRIISMRETPSGTTISNVHVRNITVEDPLPAFPPFYATMLSGTENATLNNIIFENIHQQHEGVSTSTDANQGGKPRNKLQGTSASNWENITFKNCYFNGKTLTSFEDGNFDTTYVDEKTVVFERSETAPIPDFRVNSTNIVTGQSATFTDISENRPTSWEWSFTGGDPERSNEQNPSVSYSSPGKYDVTLKVANEFGTDSITKLSFIIVDDPVPVTGVSIIECPVEEFARGNTKLLEASVQPENATNRQLIWSSSNDSIASVSGSGLVTAVSPGKAYIIAKTVDGGFTDSCSVVVNEAIDALYVADIPDLIYTEDTISVRVEYEASQARDIRVFLQLNRDPWTQYNANTITVDAGKRSESFELYIPPTVPEEVDAYKIVVNLLPIGASWPDRLDEIQKTEIDVIRWIDLENISITNCLENEIAPGKIHLFNVNLTPDNATNTTLVWKSSDPDIVTIDENGVIIAVGEGTAMITVTSEDGGFSSSCEVTVSENILGTRVAKEDFMFYPNPVNDVLHLEFNNTTKKTINLYNVAGEIIFQTETINEYLRLDLGSIYKPGIIFLKIETEKGKVYNQKVIFHK